MSSVPNKIQQAKQFLQKDIWEMRQNDLSRVHVFLFDTLKVAIILTKSFIKDRCSLHAAALTNITIMGILPMLAVVFALAKGFGAYEKLKAIALEYLSTLPESVQEMSTKLLEMIDGMVEKANFAALGTVGLVVVLWTVLGSMSKIEHSFNDIWGVQKSRTFIVKCKEYFFTLMIVPFFLMGTSALNAALKSPKITSTLDNIAGISTIYELCIQLVSPLLVILAFTYLYKFMPNTKVNFLPAFIAGIVTAISWQLLQWAYIKFQIGVANTNAIYGTFASVPLFLAWLYACWLIVILGAELSFAVQNYKTYGDENRSQNLSFQTKRQLAYLICLDISKFFHRGEQWCSTKYCESRHVPIRLGRMVLEQLCDANLLYHHDPSDNIYAPAKDLSQISFKDIELALLGNTDGVLSHIPAKELEQLSLLTNCDQFKFNELEKKVLLEIVEQGKA